MSAIPAELPQAHVHFLELVADVRPELHRYCTRMTGSVVDGEDVVQDTLAKAFYMLGMATELPPLRPWLFRVAHNTAIDFLRRYERRHVELVAEVPDGSDVDETPSSDTVRAALAAFLVLPALQRSVVILKDVLGHSSAEIAATLGTTVPAVKAALVRGRTALRTAPTEEKPPPRPRADGPERHALLERYAALFNAADWDGLRALLAEECRLDLVSRAARQGKSVGQYYARYAAAPDVRVELGTLEGREVLWCFAPKTSREPQYFIALTWDGDHVAAIRDYRYVPYIARELALVPHAVGRAP